MPTLEQMNIMLEGIGHALSDNLLAVPMYQRSYAWEDRHVADLFQDIATAIRKDENEYFLGSIVITRATANRPEVVDGQQRLATTSILLAAIRDWFFNNGDEARAQDIEKDSLTTRDFRTQETDSRLRLNQVDQDFYSKRILCRPGDGNRSIHPGRESHRRIERAAELAKQHVENIASLSNTPIESLADWIEYLNTKVKVIWVSVPSYANAFTIFETLNDRGLDLAISDLLKNHLFHLAGDRITEAQQRWISMFGALEAVGGENIVVDYIRHLWSSKYGSTREKDLYDKIKAIITSKQAAIDFTTDLAENAKLYAAILNVDHVHWKEYGSSSREHMATINLLRMIQIRPLLLAILAKYSRNEVIKVLPAMVSWVVRFLISGGLGGGMLEKHYSDRANEVWSGTLDSASSLVEKMREVVPSDRKFEVAFASARVSTNYLARYYLRGLENQFHGEENPELVPNPNEEAINLEHILPEQPSTAWSHVDAEMASAYYNRIGNLALTQVKINVEIGNDGFSEKKEYYASSGYNLTSSLTSFPEWGPEQIDTRQKELAKLAVQTWPNKIK